MFTKFVLKIMSEEKKYLIGLGIFVLIFSASTILAFTEPASPPPLNNTPAPVNVGLGIQSKNGLFSFNGGGTRGDTFLATQGGDVGIGTTAPVEKLDVAGYVRGTGLCIGTDCRTAWPSAGGGGNNGGGGGGNNGGGGGGGVAAPPVCTGNSYLQYDGTNWVCTRALAPVGAVMSFNLSACPSGWSEYVPAQARNIVGRWVGNPNYTGYDTLNETGGEFAHTLTVSEMPSHEHNIASNVITNIDYFDATRPYLGQETTAGGDTEYDLGGTATLPTVARSSLTGGGTSFNILDPFLVLLYCVKS